MLVIRVDYVNYLSGHLFRFYVRLFTARLALDSLIPVRFPDSTSFHSLHTCLSVLSS